MLPRLHQADYQSPPQGGLCVYERQTLNGDLLSQVSQQARARRVRRPGCRR